MTDIVTWHDRAATMTPDGRLFMAGQRVAASDACVFDSINPATEALVAELSSASCEDIDRAVAGARSAFSSGTWASTPAEHRAAVLRRLADAMVEHSIELALLDSLEMGKPVQEAYTGDVVRAAATFTWYAEALDKIHDVLPVTPPGSRALVTRESLGVVAALTPWNYPLEISAWKLAPALALGNSVVHKPSELTSLSALRMAELALEAGLPPDVLNVICGPGRTVGRALALDEDVDVLTFTGSTHVAKQLLINAGESNMKRLCLEAGGKSATVVFADTENLEQAAEYTAMGAFYNQGEVCSATTRIYVERSIVDEFLTLLTEKSAGYLPGDPLATESANGAMSSAAHADAVMTAIGRASRAGTVTVGGERVTINGVSNYILPTVLTDVPDTEPIWHDEIFGPAVVLAAFDSEDEAVARANSTPYGLAASLWTGSVNRAHRVSERLVAGTVSVNTVDALSLTTPFGGFKQSGFGRDLSLAAFDNYSALKTTWIQYH